MPSRLRKRAELGGQPDRSFEQALGKLAYIYVQDHAPRLVPHILGFQLVDRNEEGTRALGILGVQMGRDQIAYMPVFFLNGELKGHELLILRDKRLFVPMKEAWVNFLLADSPALDGVLAEGEPARRRASMPDLRSMILPPKMAAVVQRMPPWAVAAMPLLAKSAEEIPAAGPKLLPVLLRESVEALAALAEWRSRSVKLACALDRHYGEDFLENICIDWRSALLRERVRWPKQAAAKVQVFYYEATEVSGDLSEEERERLLQEGFLVRDRRGDEEVSTLYDLGSVHAWSTPSRSGLYDVLMHDGELEPLWVVKDPVGDVSARFLLIRPEDGGWVAAHPMDVLALERKPGGREPRFVGFTDWEGLQPGKTYVAVLNDQASVPFRVLSEEVAGSSWRVLSELLLANTVFPGSEPEGPHRFVGGCDLSRLELVEGGDRIAFSHGTLYVPDRARALRVRSALGLGVGCRCTGADAPEAAVRAIRPGGLSAVTRVVLEKTASLEVVYQHPEFALCGEQPVGYVPALESLMVRYGLREKQAREVLRRARESGRCALRVKLAQGPYLTGAGPLAPPMPEPVWSSDPTLGLPMLGQQEAAVPVEQMRGLPAPPMPFPPPSADGAPLAPGMGPGMSAGLDAAEAGQADVFDTQLVSNLLQTVRQEHLVDRYLPSLLRALDRLGRLLFNFYWHAEDFEERYGKQDLPELEDLLRNNFEVLGDLVLFLFRKSVQPSELLLSGPNIEDQPGP